MDFLRVFISIIIESAARRTNSNRGTAYKSSYRGNGSNKVKNQHHNEEENGHYQAASNDEIEGLEVAAEHSEVDEEELVDGQVFNMDDVKYTINTVNGQQEIVDENGNRYIYHDGTSAVNTELRAAQRDQIRQERQSHEEQQKAEKIRKEHQKHKAITDQIANKGNTRTYPYGLNYSEKKHDLDETEVFVPQNQYKKVTRKALNKFLNDNKVKDEYALPSARKRSTEKKKHIEFDRLCQPRHKCDSYHPKIEEEIAKKESPREHKQKQKSVKKLQNRMKNYENDKLLEIQSMQKNREEEFARVNQQFKPCKGSERIVKSLFKNEKEYSEPVHDRLYNNKPAKDKKINEIIEKANQKGFDYAQDYRTNYTSAKPAVKYTTDLSSSIDIRKRLGIEHLLPKQEFDKAATIKRIGDERKARREFEEMVRSHNGQEKSSTVVKSQKSNTENRNKTLSKPQSAGKSMNASKTARESTKKELNSKKATVNKKSGMNRAPIQPSNKSNKYLYKRLCTEFDEYVQELEAENNSQDLLSKDHIRVILVKTGFIGNDINNMAEIQNDEAMLDEIWAILKGTENGKVIPNNLKTLCGVIQGLITPVAKKNFINEESAPQDVTTEENKGLGTFNKNGTFALKSKQEQVKFSRKFGRLAANRNNFVRDRIKEKQIEKNKPTETFIPTINKNSVMIVQRKLELVNSQTGEEMVITSDQIIDGQIQQLANANNDQLTDLNQVISEIKQGDFKNNEEEYNAVYQTPEMNNQKQDFKNQQEEESM